MHIHQLLSLAVLILTELSYGTSYPEFVLVSTTPTPTHSNNVEQQINNLQDKILENTKRLEKIEARIEKIYTILEQRSHSSFSLNKATSVKLFSSNCTEIQAQGSSVSNFHYVKPPLAPKAILVFCDMQTRGGGWIYVLNRFNGSQSFDLGWHDYKHGFGNVDGELWLGLDNIHYLTGSDVNELLIELVDWDSRKVYAHYDSFSVGDENEGYVLKLVTGYSGDAGDSFSYHAGMRFSTKGIDHDQWAGGSCASSKNTGWWFRDCTQTLLTGKYLKKDDPLVDTSIGIYWSTFHGYSYSFKEVRMMIRPRGHNVVP